MRFAKAFYNDFANDKKDVHQQKVVQILLQQGNDHKMNTIHIRMKQNVIFIVIKFAFCQIKLYYLSFGCDQETLVLVGFSVSDMHEEKIYLILQQKNNKWQFEHVIVTRNKQI